jgi:glutamate carboxypeptidase
MGSPTNLLGYFASGLDSALGLLRRLVELESCSYDKSGIDALSGFIGSQLGHPGVSVQSFQEASRGNHLLAKWSTGSSRKPLLLLGHLDTVWPSGTLRERPFIVENGIARGPGVFDMKSGLLLYILVFKAMLEGRCAPGRDVWLFLTSDEEVGTETGLGYLRRIAPCCGAVLCAEPPLSGGRAKTARSGTGSFTLRVRGLQSHAGVDHAAGASAILELSRLVVILHGMNDQPRGILINVGVIRGGIAANVVAGEAEGQVDFRFKSMADGYWLENQIRSLRPVDPRCSIFLDGGINRPPLERTEAVKRLYETAKAEAAGLGLELGEGETGGGSDGSFTAAMGIATLDGLGVDGGGAHAVTEHVIVQDIPRRAALLCRLIENIEE